MTLQTRLERVWLTICFICIIVGTLGPFEFSAAQPELSERARGAIDVYPLDAAKDFPVHFVGFATLGLLIAGVYGERLRRHPRVFVLLTAFAGCVALDVAQLLIPLRHARVSDIATNGAGLCFGLWACVYTRGGRRLLDVVQTAAARRWRWVAGGVVAASLLIWSVIALQPALGSLRLGWDPSFHLLVGNEIIPPRPWLGEMRFVRIYGRALSTTEIENLHTRSPSSADLSDAPDDLLVGYDFRERLDDLLAPEGSLDSAGLELRIPESIAQSADGPARFARPTVMVSHGRASILTDAISASGAFSIEASFRPANLEQGGPARIVSLSDGWRKRNFMFGQEGADLVFRVRNEVNGLSGSPYALQTPNIVEAGWQHVVAVYDHGVSVLYKNGQVAGSVDLLEPSFYFPLGKQRTGWVVIALLLVVTVALPLSLFLRSTPTTTKHALALGLTFAAGCAPYAASCLIVGGPMRLDYLAWLLVAMLGAYFVVVRYVSAARPVGESRKHGAIREPVLSA